MVKGSFSGRVETIWLDNGRDMMIMKELIYLDKKGRFWVALPGDIINGASILKGVWSIIGSPYVGLYRRASVIHDVYCDSKRRPYKQVHRVFNEMMQADNVDRATRKVIFKAVWLFGPRW